MSDDPNVKNLKAEERMKVEVPIEEDVTKVDVPPEGVNINEELGRLGQQFAETLKSAWNSEERQKFEKDVREGLQSFATEVDKVITNVKTNPTTEKVVNEASQAAKNVETSDVGQKTKAGLAQGLKWLSVELSTIAEKFSAPEEKAPEDNSAE